MSGRESRLLGRWGEALAAENDIAVLASGRPVFDTALAIHEALAK